MHPGGEGGVRGEKGEKPGDEMHHRRCGEVPTGSSVELLFCLGLVQNAPLQVDEEKCEQVEVEKCEEVAEEKCEVVEERQCKVEEKEVCEEEVEEVCNQVRTWICLSAIQMMAICMETDI